MADPGRAALTPRSVADKDAPEMPMPAKLLHVEDDLDIQMIARMVLVDLGGFDVLQCASGAEAVEKAEAFAPDMLLLDYMMPEMNGLATLRALREIPALRQVPAAFMTAKVLDLSQSELEALGVVGILSKPFDPVSLPEQIGRLWQKAAG